MSPEVCTTALPSPHRKACAGARTEAWPYAFSGRPLTDPSRGANALVGRLASDYRMLSSRGESHGIGRRSRRAGGCSLGDSPAWKPVALRRQPRWKLTDSRPQVPCLPYTRRLVCTVDSKLARLARGHGMGAMQRWHATDNVAHAFSDSGRAWNEEVAPSWPIRLFGPGGRPPGTSARRFSPCTAPATRPS